ncbi:MAG: hemerythrin [Desulfuromonas sp.]|nr:MAG: hemerythrin [Desulfuromonas sp.]
MGFAWSPELSIGFEKIDQQHEELLRRFNSLQVACRSGQSKEDVRKLFNFLDNYVMEHFTDEERLMYTYRYPEIMTHQQEHLELITKLRKLKRQIHEYDISASLVEDITQTMFRWIVDHIQGADVQFGKYLAKKSVQAAKSL